MWNLIALFLGLLAKWFHVGEPDRIEQGEDAGKAMAEASHDEKVLRDVSVAQSARDSVDTELRKHPDELRNDDGFRRG